MAGSCRRALAETGSGGTRKGSSYQHALELCGDVFGRAPVEIHACPDLEVHERSEAFGAVDTVLFMLCDQPAYRGRNEQAAALERIFRQQLIHHRRALLLEPSAPGRAEAALLAVQ